MRTSRGRHQHHLTGGARARDSRHWKNIHRRLHFCGPGHRYLNICSMQTFADYKRGNLFPSIVYLGLLLEVCIKKKCTGISCDKYSGILNYKVG